MKDWLKSLYIRSLQLANTKWSVWALFICAFADASFLPMPTQLFFMTLVLINSKKSYQYVLFATLGTFFGALLGYAIGHFAWLDVNGEFTGLARFVFDNIPGFTESVYQYIHIQYVKWDLLILFIAPFIPIPYKIISISSGVFDMNILVFLLGTLFSQCLRFYLLAFMVIKLGPWVLKIFEFKTKPLAILIAAGVAIAIIAIKIF